MRPTLRFIGRDNWPRLLRSRYAVPIIARMTKTTISRIARRKSGAMVETAVGL
jgi:hypothetical protein